MDFKKNYLRDVPFEQSIKRGTAEVIEESDTGIFLWEKMGWVYMLVTDDYEEGKDWLIKHEAKGYDLMTLYRDDLSKFAAERYGLTIGRYCYQGVWLKSEAPKLKGILDFRLATLKDMDFILEHYTHGNEDWMTEVIKEKLLYIAQDHEGNDVGMGGIHLEGSIGMMEILPQFRNKGYATEIESFLIDKVLKAGLTPYGQVYSNNDISMSLQRKIGFEFWDGKMCWLYRE